MGQFTCVLLHYHIHLPWDHPIHRHWNFQLEIQMSVLFDTVLLNFFGKISAKSFCFFSISNMKLQEENVLKVNSNFYFLTGNFFGSCWLVTIQSSRTCIFLRKYVMWSLLVWLCFTPPLQTKISCFRSCCLMVRRKCRYNNISSSFKTIHFRITLNNFALWSTKSNPIHLTWYLRCVNIVWHYVSWHAFHSDNNTKAMLDYCYRYLTITNLRV